MKCTCPPCPPPNRFICDHAAGYSVDQQVTCTAAKNPRYVAKMSVKSPSVLTASVQHTCATRNPINPDLRATPQVELETRACDLQPGNMSAIHIVPAPGYLNPDAAYLTWPPGRGPALLMQERRPEPPNLNAASPAGALRASFNDCDGGCETKPNHVCRKEEEQRMTLNNGTDQSGGVQEGGVR